MLGLVLLWGVPENVSWWLEAWLTKIFIYTQALSRLSCMESLPGSLKTSQKEASVSCGAQSLKLAATNGKYLYKMTMYAFSRACVALMSVE